MPAPSRMFMSGGYGGRRTVDAAISEAARNYEANRQVVKPRRANGARPTCETVMAAAYFKRAYAARDAMQLRMRHLGDVTPVGHLDGGYCLDRPEPATGSHRCWDFVFNEGGILLNIGLRIGIGDHVNSVHHTLGVIERIAGFPWAYTYVPAQCDDTEPTVVVCLKRDRDFGVSPEMIRAVSLASSLPRCSARSASRCGTRRKAAAS